MSTLEDRVRRALAEDPTSFPVEQFLADVHRGARARRTRRTAAVCGVAIAVSAAVVSLAAWWGGPPSRQEPAPPVDSGPAHVVPLDGPQLMAPVPAGADGRLYGLTGFRNCGQCNAIFWMEDDDGHQENIHAFDREESVSQVTMAPDLVSGFAFGFVNHCIATTCTPRTLVLRTQDAGRSWSHVDQELADYAYSPRLAILGEYAYLVTRSMDVDPRLYSGPHFWRTNLHNDEWQELPLPGKLIGPGYDAGLLAIDSAVGGPAKLVLITKSRVRSSTDGEHWSNHMSLPCTQGASFAGATPTTIFVSCPASGDQSQLFRSVDLGSFEPIGPPLLKGGSYPMGAHLVGPLPVDAGQDGALAVVQTSTGFRLLGPGAKSTLLHPDWSLFGDPVAEPWITAHTDTLTYALVGPDSGVQVTSDAGQTWVKLPRSP